MALLEFTPNHITSLPLPNSVPNFGKGQFVCPEGVAVDSSGNVYVVDSGNGRVEKFDGSGNFLLQWGSEGVGTGQFSTPEDPEGVAVDGSGNVYVTDSGANNCVEKFGDSLNSLVASSPFAFPTLATCSCCILNSATRHMRDTHWRRGSEL